MTVITDAREVKKSHRKKDPIKLCARLTAKFPKTAFKSNIIRFKMDEDPLQRRIYFLTFVESLEMIFSQHIETCKVITYYPKIGRDDIGDYAKKTIRNILHENMDVHSRRLIAEFLMDGIKCIEKLLSHCAKITFSDKIIYDRTFQQVTQKWGGSSMNYIKRSHNAHDLSISVGNTYSEDRLMHTFLDNFHQSGKYYAQIASH